MLRVSDKVMTDETDDQSSNSGAVTASTDHTATDDPNVLLGRIAMHYEVLSQEDVEDALAAWQAKADGQDFAAFLTAGNYLDSETLGKLVQVRNMYQQKGAESRAPVAKAADPEPAPPTESSATSAGEPVAAAINEEALKAPEVDVREPEAVLEPEEVIEATIAQETTSETVVEAQVRGDKAELLRYGPGVSLQDLLQQTIEMHASDLHVHSGARLCVRFNGDIQTASAHELSSTECASLIDQVLNESQRSKLKEKFQVDFAYEIPGVGRFRANVYHQRRGTDAVFRTIKPKPPSLASLGLPSDLKQYTELHQGLVLFTGPAGCGKSSTMAAMVDLVNQNRPDHILTIEDPIEYVHNSMTCSINQREAGVHTDSFSKALRAALREDPDVIVIGELRDYETISLALTAAETGHLVMGTLHTSGAIRTVNRLLGVFPPDQQSQVRMMMSEALKVVISQRLIHRADGRGRAVALEVMVNNQAIGNLIRSNRTFQIKSIMQTGTAQGQLLLDSSLATLLSKRVITKETAIMHADEPENFK